MNSVVIPCFNRADYLTLCLEYIMKADNWDQYKYIFACDIGTTKDVYQVINQFVCKNKFKITPKPHSYKLGKQSFNVMNGLLCKETKESNFIFYIEDDVFIAKDFFTFSEKIHKKESPFVSILSKNMNSSTPESPLENINAYYVKFSNEYQGIGSCFNKNLLNYFLQQHFQQTYFMSPTSYVKNNFPNSKLNSFYAEQDGLIRRIIEKNNLKVCFSHIPRCFHAGFYGYHRNPKINLKTMTLKQRCDFIRKTAFDISELQKISQNQYFINDSLPINLLTLHNDCYRIDI